MRRRHFRLSGKQNHCKPSSFQGFHLPFKGIMFRRKLNYLKNSKSAAGDSVPVRVRSPAPINPIVNDTFTMGFILCTGRARTACESPGSEGSAAGGGRSDPSEWQRSVCNAAASSARRTPGTATGHRHISRRLLLSSHASL